MEKLEVERTKGRPVGVQIEKIYSFQRCYYIRAMSYPRSPQDDGYYDLLSSELSIHVY